MSLYTKYRPRDWDSVVGQDRIKTILRNSLTHDRTGHAYLFHGSRGTGKTTSARILAKGVNCTDLRDGNPCHMCANCLAFDNGTMLDIIEIDAASNTGVDNIRELIERARFEPNQGKYKVYIIDEVHMLSTGAFNALLKTLEEPPEHVKFILATTEADKVPETIRSRTLRFDFRKITENDIIDRIRFVATAEHIRTDEEAIKIIAKYARGGLRDALTLLEQNTVDGELSLEHVRMTLSLLEESQITAIIESLRICNMGEILSTIESLGNMHVNARGFFEQIMYQLRDLMILHLYDAAYYEYQELYEFFESAYTRVRSIPDGMLLIEITLLKIGKRRDGENRKQETGSRNEKEIKKESMKIDEKNKMETQEKKMGAQNKENTVHGFPTKELSNNKDSGDTGLQGQKQTEQILPASEGQEQSEGKNEEKSPHIPFSYITLLDRVKSSKPALVMDLKTARFELGNNSITFIFQKNWNYSRVNTPDIRGILTEILGYTFGGEWTVECKLEEVTMQANIADDVF